MPHERVQNRNMEQIVASLGQERIIEVWRRVHQERGQQHMMTRRQVLASQVQSPDEVVDILVVMQRQVPSFQLVQKTLEVLPMMRHVKCPSFTYTNG